MPQRKLLVSDLMISYEGLFDSADLFRLIDDWFKQHGYDKKEIKHIERIREKGKTIDYEIMPFRKITEYTQYDLNVRVIINDMTQAEMKKEGKKFTINKGKVSIVLNAFLVSDVTERWESRPFMFFLRTIFDKFINKKYTTQYEKGLMADVQALHSELKAYLNLNRYVTPS